MKNGMSDLRKAATKLGATVEVSDGYMLSVNVDAPERMIWRADGGHCLTSTCYRGKGATAEVVADLLDRMAYGIEACTEPDCEYCNP